MERNERRKAIKETGEEWMKGMEKEERTKECERKEKKQEKRNVKRK